MAGCQAGSKRKRTCAAVLGAFVPSGSFPMDAPGRRSFRRPTDGRLPVFRLIRHSRNEPLWVLFTSVALVLITLPSYVVWAKVTKSWPSWKEALIQVDPHLIVGLLTAFAVFVVVDRIVEYWLRRAFKAQFSWIWRLVTGSNRLKRTITQDDVDIVLGALAKRFKWVSDEQHRIDAIAKASPHDSWCQADKRSIDYEVGVLLKKFRRAYWLARLYGFTVKKSWKNYLPPAQPA